VSIDLGVGESVDEGPQQFAETLVQLDEHVNSCLTHSPIVVVVRLQRNTAQHTIRISAPTEKRTYLQHDEHHPAQ